MDLPSVDTKFVNTNSTTRTRDVPSFIGPLLSMATGRLTGPSGDFLLNSSTYGPTKEQMSRSAVPKHRTTIGQYIWGFLNFAAKFIRNHRPKVTRFGFKVRARTQVFYRSFHDNGLSEKQHYVTKRHREL